MSKSLLLNVFLVILVGGRGWSLPIVQEEAEPSVLEEPEEDASPSDDGAVLPPPEEIPSRTESYLLFLKARERERIGDVESALEAYRQALEQDPDSVAIRVALATLLADSHRVAEAMDVLRDALRQDPDDVSARRLLAGILYRLRGESYGEHYDRDVRTAFEDLVRLDPEDQEARRTLGKLAYDQQDYERAREAFEQVLREHPGDHEARIFLARTYFQLRDYDRAAQVYVALERELGALPAQERSGQVLSYLFAERYQEAIQVAEAGIASTGEDSPEHLKFLKLKGFAASGLGDHRLAAETFTRVLELDPGDRESRFRLAMAEYRRRSLEPALAELRKVKREIENTPQGPGLDPPYPQVLQVMGAILMDRNETEEAIELLSMAHNLLEPQEPLYATVVPRLARALVEVGRGDEARDLLTELVELGPEYRGFLLEIAELRIRAGDEREGAKLIKRYLRETPEEQRLDSNLMVADLYNRLERYEEALDVLREVRRDFPDDENVYFLTGTALERLQRLDEAREAFEKILEINPDSHRTLNYLGYMLVDADRDLEESLAYIERAVELDPYNGAYLDSLGWAWFKLGNPEKARRFLERAVEQIVDDPVIHDHLADVYFALERYDEAVAFWKRALEYGAGSPDIIRRKIEEVGALRTSRRN